MRHWPTDSTMKRGEIFFATLDPTVGNEIRKRRPVVIVSNDANNRAAGVVTVVPLTSNIARIHPFEVLLPATATGLPKDSKAVAQQIRTLSKQRLTARRVGVLAHSLLADLDAALRLHLDL
jgi:mRNA interferase MazF